MKFLSLLAGLALSLLVSGAAFAQCGTTAPANKFCGNDTGASALATWKTVPAGALSPIPGGTVLGNNGAVAATPAALNNPVLGVPGSLGGALGIAGATSGTAILQAQPVAGSGVSLLPTVSGTLVSTASAPLAINSATGLLSITGQAGGVLAGAGPAFTRTPVLGVNGTAAGTLGFAGATSGIVTIQPQAAAGTVSLTLPNTAGTFAVGASSPLVLSATTGGLTCPTCVTSSGGGAITGVSPISVSAAGAVSIPSLTGTGSTVVLQTSPSLITPALGVATGTSLAIGGCTIGTDTLCNTGTTAHGGAVRVTSTSASALAVGANGTTNPGLQVDASTASAATGVAVTSLAAGSGVRISAISSGTNETLGIQAKGTGSVNIASISTGAVNLATGGGGVQIASAITYGGVTLNNAVTGTGNMVLSASPTFSGTVAGNGTHPVSLLANGTQDTVVGYFSSTAAGTIAVPNCFALAYSTVGHAFSCSGSALTNSLVANVSLNSTGSYFIGPTVAQGSTGTWLATGSVTLVDTAGAAQFNCILTDGTTVFASGRGDGSAANVRLVIALSGVITSPAGNIRIACNDASSTSGVMAFNATGNSKDSTVSAVRIQ